ncbi:MAG: DUF427 domain-containing protein [Candidatus Promineifilaceae bacterium]|nr:DUF427 domain-containing protein [Candidatus Promineifilaceae bacterium]
MPKAFWNGAVLAESDETVVVDGDHYFPPETLNQDHLEKSHTRTICPWKGQATYYNVIVNGTINRDAAWSYSTPKPVAMKIRGYVAFWRGVQVVD